MENFEHLQFVEEAWSPLWNLHWKDKQDFRLPQHQQNDGEKVRKVLEDSGFNYEVITEKRTHDQWSDNIRIPESVAEIQEIKNNDPSKLMCFIAREKDARGHSAIFLQDEEGTQEKQPQDTKKLEPLQELHVLWVLLQWGEFLSRPEDQHPDKQVTHCLTQRYIESHVNEISSSNHNLRCYPYWGWYHATCHSNPALRASG